jgi:hypothetical protein
MKNKLTIIFLVVVGLMTVSFPLAAHHGNAAYATGTKITVKGTVTEWFWANPHCFLKLDAKDEKGEVQHWVVEASNPPDMTRQGWAKTSFKAGDEVVVTMMIPKNGAPGIGRFMSGPNSIELNGQPFPSGVPNSTQRAPKP